MRITILGGDARNEFLAAMLAGDGHAVVCCGLSGAVKGCEATDEPENACLNANIIIGPTPCIKDGLFNAPSAGRPITPNEVIHLLRSGIRFAAGAIPKSFREAVSETGASCFDFLEDEALAQANAIPSAEGAIGIAMRRMDITLAGCEALVLGYGRIGENLARILRGIGSHVTVFARREEILEKAWREGAQVADESRLNDALARTDCVFNTIPALILNAERLRNIDPRCIVIDLASAPGGVAFEAAKALGLNASLEPGLPGRVAPRSAALYMKQALDRLFKGAYT